MRILTHNVYWFQGSPSRWGEERVRAEPEVLDALIGLYARADVDVLCLQEVPGGDLVQSIAHELGMSHCLRASGGLRPEYGGAILSRRHAQIRDCTRTRKGTAHERVHLRASLKFMANRFELAVVHLPSNRFADSAAAGDSARVAELRLMLDESPRPDLVVGDMNCWPDSLPYRVMRKSDYVDSWIAAGRESTGHGPDYMWLHESCADRLTGFSLLDRDSFCRTTPEGDPWRLSDHPPLLLELK